MRWEVRRAKQRCSRAAEPTSERLNHGCTQRGRAVVRNFCSLKKLSRTVVRIDTRAEMIIRVHSSPFAVTKFARLEEFLSMNRRWFGVPPSGGTNSSDRLKPGLQTASGSRAQCTVIKSWGLSMNRSCCGSQTRAPERASVRRSGSWSRCMRQGESRLSVKAEVNRTG